MSKLKFGLIAFTLFIGATSFAQTTPRDEAKMEADRLAKELTLDENQKMFLTELNIGLMHKREAIDKNTSLTSEQRELLIKDNQHGKDSQLKEILTKEQYSRYLQLQNEKKDQKIDQKNDQKKSNVKMKS